MFGNKYNKLKLPDCAPGRPVNYSVHNSFSFYLLSIHKKIKIFKTITFFALFYVGVKLGLSLRKAEDVRGWGTQEDF